MCLFVKQNCGALSSWPPCLTPEQADELAPAVTEHLKTAIRGEADAQALMVDLRYGLRSRNLNLQRIEDPLTRISARELQLQAERVRLYDSILKPILSEAQYSAWGF